MSRLVPICALAIVLVGCGDDRPVLDARIGGEATREVVGRNAFSFPAPTLTDEERRRFEIGDSFFTQNWVTAPASTDARDGLGPLFNTQACSSCHLRDGRGAPASTGEGELGLLLRLSVPDSESDGGVPHPVYGGQLQDRAIVGVAAEGRLEVTYTEVGGEYGDETPFSLRSPDYAIDEPAYGPLGEVMVSPRLAPQLVGMGLLEAIPAADLLSNADPDDDDGDGISGRVNRVVDPATGRTAIGRFGWKANEATLESQAAGAFAGDLGITSSLSPEPPCTPTQVRCNAAPDGGSPELTDDRLGSVTFYTRTLAVPAMRGTDDDGVRSGAAVFEDLGCSSCHISTFATADTDVAALSGQSIHPYTDLLLHDMGPALADGRSDHEASGSEWRTPPLWGLGLIEDVNGERFLLHDGRARTIEEAILWHGGEARPAREAFRRATADQRFDLVRFLESL